MTGDLFATQRKTERAVEVETEPLSKTCPKVEAYGEKDKQGEYYYQRTWREIQALTPLEQQALRTLLLSPAARFTLARKILNRHARAHQFDRDDLEAALLK